MTWKRHIQNYSDTIPVQLEERFLVWRYYLSWNHRSKWTGVIQRKHLDLSTAVTFLISNYADQLSSWEPKKITSPWPWEIAGFAFYVNDSIFRISDAMQGFWSKMLDDVRITLLVRWVRDFNPQTVWAVHNSFIQSVTASVARVILLDKTTEHKSMADGQHTKRQTDRRQKDLEKKRQRGQETDTVTATI